MKSHKESILDFISYLRCNYLTYRGKTYKLNDTDLFPKDIRFLYPSFVKVKDPFCKKYPKETLDILKTILYNIGKGISVKAFEETIKQTDNILDVWEVSEKAFINSKKFKTVKRKKDTSFYEKIKEK